MPDCKMIVPGSVDAISECNDRNHTILSRSCHLIECNLYLSLGTVARRPSGRAARDDNHVGA